MHHTPAPLLSPPVWDGSGTMPEEVRIWRAAENIAGQEPRDRQILIGLARKTESPVIWKKIINTARVIALGREQKARRAA